MHNTLGDVSLIIISREKIVSVIMCCIQNTSSHGRLSYVVTKAYSNLVPRLFPLLRTRPWLDLVTWLGFGGFCS